MEPEFGQRRENDGEISAAVGGKESGYVLNENPSSGANKLPCEPGELEEQAGSLPGEPPSSSGDGEVLAREPACE